jgi:16S rRNA (uracil1498-N3)-methyltransferase
MTRRRWIADEVHENTALLTGEHASHLSRVLRAQVGQEFDISTGNGVRRGSIISISDERVEFALASEVEVKASARVTLLLAIFKFDRMEWAIEKCTEIGVARIIPIVARRTDVHLAAASDRRHERWLRIVRQASEQSRRVSPPEVSTPIKLKDLASAGDSLVSPVESGEPALPTGARRPRIVLAESEMNNSLRDVLAPSTSEAFLAVGPEGGWTHEELSWFRQAGWAAASLGDTILRAETAAIVATALALDLLR